MQKKKKLVEVVSGFIRGVYEKNNKRPKTSLWNTQGADGSDEIAGQRNDPDRHPFFFTLTDISLSPSFFPVVFFLNASLSLLSLKDLIWFSYPEYLDLAIDISIVWRFWWHRSV